MNIHEYQAKQLLKEYGLPVSDGRVVLKADEAKTAAGELDGPIWVVKAQIHAGGRGKGRFKEASAGEKGGVRVTKSVSEAADEAQRMLGRTLVTHQTGPAGKVVNRVYIEDGSDIARELYLALLIDRGVEPDRLRLLDRGRHGHRGGGGEDAGEGADLHRRPGLGHLRLPRPPRRLRARARGQAGQAVRRPDQPALPAVHREGRRDAGDQPADRDARTATSSASTPRWASTSNALYRQKDILALRDETEEDPKELAASKFDLNYIALDGEIGCMVNGAGLAMATMDIIKLYGARAGELPRRRRRRDQGEGDRGVQDHHLRPEGEGHPRQHLRRHHALRRHRRGGDRGGEGGRARRCRWWCGSRGRTSSWGRRS